MKNSILLGYAPTRRNLFSAPDANRYNDLTRARLQELNIAFTDIQDINEEGLLYNDNDLPKIIKKFQQCGVDGLFVPHCNFGTEYVVARLAKALRVPVLLWGPRDEAPEENGARLRDSQCGLFATGKILRRFGVPFTYMTNCRLTDPEFERGITDFVRVCNVVKAFRNARILQISTRPFDFWSTMCNEGELLERFGIQLAPVPITDLTQEMRNVRSDQAAIFSVCSELQQRMEICVTQEELIKIAALKIAMERMAKQYGCSAIAIQCWNALQQEIGIMPCCANALLTEEGLPVVCETDIHGAITSILVQAAVMGKVPTFFADWTVRHPENDNAELLQHCGPWPLSLAQTTPKLGKPFAFQYPGSVAAEAQHADKITLARFDGDMGNYSLLLGNAKAVDGPYNNGTYLWVEVQNLKRLEAKLVEGPYIHHCTGVFEDVVPVLYEACKYLSGVKPDLYDPIEEEIRAYLRGE